MICLCVEASADILDSPDLQVNMDPILQHIHTCNEKALAREQDSKRTAPLSNDDDPRVDVCIYFLSPHRIKPIDIKFITELSALVPLIPVLAKADSMTTKELDQHRKGVREALNQVCPLPPVNKTPPLASTKLDCILSRKCMHCVWLDRQVIACFQGDAESL